MDADIARGGETEIGGIAQNLEPAFIRARLFQ
jgi:hypothetical protein